MIHALAHAVDVALPVTATVADRYRTMIENGCGDRDSSELVRLYRDKNRSALARRTTPRLVPL